MKIVFLCLIICCCTYIGYGFSTYYRKRLRFFKDACDFASKLIVEINFSKTNLKNIIANSLNVYGSDFKFVLNNFSSYLSKEVDSLTSDFLLKKNFNLGSEDKQTLFLFFKSLGRYDAENQILEIENFKNKLEDVKKQCEVECKKYSSLYIKLGLMLGILIAIILL